MKEKRNYESVFTFERLQFKSIGKIKEFCRLLNIMEVEFGVRTGKVELKECFICPDITEDEFHSLNDNETERMIHRVIIDLELGYMPR